MTSSGISQKEYLKKYLSSRNDEKKKKKKLKAKPSVNRMKIVDDDIDISAMQSLDNVELELYDLQEDAPQIAGFIDERPEEVQIKEKFETKKWKVVAGENDEELKVIDKSNLNISYNDTQRTVVGSDGDMSPRNMKIERDVSKTSSLCDSQQIRHCDSDESLPRKPKGVSDHSPSSKTGIKGRGKYQANDVSPPRKSKKNDAAHSRHNYVSDESPPRKSKENDLQSDNKKKSKYCCDSDESPPRKMKNDFERANCSQGSKRDFEEHNPRRSRRDDAENTQSSSNHKYDSDESPPRRNKRSYSDLKMSRHDHSKRNHKRDISDQEVDSDESPPRKTDRDSSLYSQSLRGKPTKADKSLLSRRKSSSREDGKKETSQLYRDNRDSDAKRRELVGNVSKALRKNDSDESPPRRNKKPSLSPQNRSRRRYSESPPHRYDKRKSGHRREYDRGEMSRQTSRSNNEDTRHQRDSGKSRSPPGYHKNSSSYHGQHESSDKKKEGKRPPSQAKLNDVNSRREQNQEISKNDHKKLTMDGRKAGLVDAGELKAEIANLRSQEKQVFANMDPSVSGKGAAPILRDRKTGKKRDLEEEARIQQEKDEKQAERDSKYMQWGKGLKQVSDQEQKIKEALHEMSKPLARYADDEDLDKYLREQEREGDPMLAYIKSKKGEKEKGKPQYEGSYMPNRFGIRPGHRWDGVDRSNGYEKQWFEAQNAKKAVEEEAYKWSTSDM